MSQENVEIVRNVYEALNRDDWDMVFAMRTRTSNLRPSWDPIRVRAGGVSE